VIALIHSSAARRASIIARRWPRQSTGPPLKGRKAARRPSSSPAAADIHFVPFTLAASCAAPPATALPGAAGAEVASGWGPGPLAGADASQRSGRNASGASQYLRLWCRP